mmetsp:Transcript_16624/g.36870  ORF Transcript_16624/g.36870 Transcript_16624/m.36870 type:complete len:119 (-) Transcript_16624:1579-1935(-)
MTSASCTVVRRWAITMSVRGSCWLPSALTRLLSACRDSCTSCSVSVSKEEVASSSSTMGASFSRHLARATRCFSPPDSFRPRSPTIVSSPRGRRSMRPSRRARRAASRTSSSVALSFP